MWGRPTPRIRLVSSNPGYWGFALRPSTTYKGSFYAKAGSSDLGPVTVSLVSDDTGKVVTATEVSSIGNRLEAIRVLTEDRRYSAPQSRTISFSASATPALSGCSLSPFSRPLTTIASAAIAST